MIEVFRIAANSDTTAEFSRSRGHASGKVTQTPF